MEYGEKHTDLLDSSMTITKMFTNLNKAIKNEKLYIYIGDI